MTKEKNYLQILEYKEKELEKQLTELAFKEEISFEDFIQKSIYIASELDSTRKTIKQLLILRN